MAEGVGGPPPGYINISLQDIDRLVSEGKKFEFKDEAQRQEFVELVTTAKYGQGEIGDDFNPVLQIPEPVNAAELGLVGDKLGKSAENLGFNITQLLSLMHELGVEIRQSEKGARAVLREVAQEKYQAIADKIRSAADFALAAAVVSGSMQIAGGAITIGTSVAGMSKLSKLELKSTSGDLQSQIKDFKATLPEKTGGTTPTDLSLDAPTGRSRSNAITSTTDPRGPDATTGRSRSDAITSRNDPRGPDASEGTGSSSQTSAASLEARAEARIHNQQQFEKLQMKMQVWSGISQVVQGLGQVASGALSHQEAMQQAEQKLLEGDLAQIQYLIADQDQIISDQGQRLGETRSTLRDINSSNAQAFSKIYS